MSGTAELDLSVFRRKQTARACKVGAALEALDGEDLALFSAGLEDPQSSGPLIAAWCAKHPWPVCDVSRQAIDSHRNRWCRCFK